MENSTTEVTGPADKVIIISISFQVLAIFAAIFGNSLVLRAFHKFPSLRTASNTILVSLSAADILTVIPFILHISFIALELEGNLHSISVQFLCKSSARLSLLVISVIILHLVLISVDRFIAVKFALRYHTIVTYRRAMVVCLIVWLWAIAVTLLFPMTLKEDSSDLEFERLSQALHPCYKVKKQTPRQKGLKRSSSSRGYLTFVMISLLAIPVLIILCTYGYVFFVSLKHRKQIRQQGNIQGMSIINDELKAACTLAIVVGVCLLIFLPLLVVMKYRFFDIQQVVRKKWLKYIVYDVALGLNACLSLVIYAWRHEKLKTAFRKLLRCA